MQNAETQEFLKFKFDRYLSKNFDDGDVAREMPAIRPGEFILPSKCLTLTLKTPPETLVPSWIVPFFYTSLYVALITCILFLLHGLNCVIEKRDRQLTK